VIDGFGAQFVVPRFVGIGQFRPTLQHRTVGEEQSARTSGAHAVRACRELGAILGSSPAPSYVPQGLLRTMTVHATLAGAKRVRMVWYWRPCLAADGNPNEPNAARQNT
jgi:hypothetical protein